jgi:hypothetical protein
VLWVNLRFSPATKDGQMASQELVKHYLAYWFQIGKPVIIRDGQLILKPNPVLYGNRFSQQFETCWAEIMATEGRGCYLEGTHETIADLLSERWEICNCARCTVPVPQPMIVLEPLTCPCNNLVTWPNNEVPLPHLPIDNNRHLTALQQRLVANETDHEIDHETDVAASKRGQ